MTNQEEQQYLDLLATVIDQPMPKESRTGVRTYSMFGEQMRFSLRDGVIPLLTTKLVNLRPLIRELLWFISGSTNINDMGAKIWDQWATPDGDLGPLYGQQWRGWEDTRVVSDVEYHNLKPYGYTKIGTADSGDLVIQRKIDQIATIVEQLRQTPDSRRIIISAWNPSVLPDESISPQANVHLGNAALAACHTVVQFYTRELCILERIGVALSMGHVVGEDPQGGYAGTTAVLDTLNVPSRALSCQLLARSQDLPLGTPFNIASYGLLTHMIARVTGMIAEELVWVGGDCHVYENQVEGVREQLRRTPKPFPKIEIAGVQTTLDDFSEEDFMLVNYNPDTAIKFPIAV